MSAAANGRAVLAVNAEAIPPELKARRQWVLWRQETRRGKSTKVPYRSNGKPAKSNDAASWMTFEAVWTFYRMHPGRYSGVGYVFAPDDPYCGVDLDLCLRPDGTLMDWAAPVLEQLPSYTEVSPSGLGLKIIARGRFPGASTGKTFRDLAACSNVDGKQAELCVWNERRFFTFTGRVFNGHNAITDCQAGADQIYRQYWGEPKPKKSEVPKNSRNLEHGDARNGADVHPAALGAMRRATKAMRDNSDGSKRLFCISCRAVEHDLSPQQALATIRAYERSQPFSRDYSDAEILKRVEDAEQHADRGKALLEKRELTDMGNGERFADLNGENVRYVQAWNKWLTWTGRRWRVDDTGVVMRMAKQTAKTIYAEAAAAESDKEADAIVRFAKASQSRSRLDAMLELAKSEPPIAISQASLDSDPWLLNFENGTVDLRTGKLKPHDAGDLISKTTGVEYPDEPGVDAILWQEFLNTIFRGDVELIRFLQRLMGSALPGVVLEHILPIFYGIGSNGKTVFIETTKDVLGEYAMKAPPGLLMTSRGERHPTELADLYGMRLVAITETGDGQRLDERLVKETTGGDTIRARRMREDFWEFRPSHLSVLVTNYKPVVRGTDYGLWRRLRLVPFTVTIPDEKQDKRLLEKLRAEFPAIARWMVEGCLDWQCNGLAAPSQVMVATDGYKEESDTFAQWFKEYMKVEPSGCVRASAAFRSYIAWCEQACERNLSNRRFGERMGEKIIAKRVSNGTWYDGVAFQNG